MNWGQVEAGFELLTMVGMEGLLWMTKLPQIAVVLRVRIDWIQKNEERKDRYVREIEERTHKGLFKFWADCIGTGSKVANYIGGVVGDWDGELIFISCSRLVREGLCKPVGRTVESDFSIQVLVFKE